VYATPAPNPPSIPTKLGKLADIDCGFIINNAPINATITAKAWNGFTFSLSTKYEHITAKNGDSLLSIDASDKTRWSIA
jgi:hypothetical protein